MGRKKDRYVITRADKQNEKLKAENEWEQLNVDKEQLSFEKCTSLEWMYCAKGPNY